MDEPLTSLEILELLKKLDLKPIELTRKNEPTWKEEFKDKEQTDEQIVQAMADYPKLIQRPIVVLKDKVVLGSSIERINDLINV